MAVLDRFYCTIFYAFSDPSHVIGLYPNLLPQDFRRQLDYPEKLPDLEGSDLEKGLMALIDYLKDVSSLWTLCEKGYLTFKKLCGSVKNN